MDKKVELRLAKIPYIGFMAVHYWFVVHDVHRCDRWEVWQNRDRGGKSWGHLHQNLMGVYQGVGNGDSWQEYLWQGKTAHRLMRVIENSYDHYPHCYLYRYFPGPNSNTYVAWVLNQAQINYSLSIKGIGKDY
ncbi:hypothetical protein Cyast_1639 [Cyanobacterium stanieri PCC 7202]|uniref:DUF3750 domain-containing protein n=1 Tax=Cyanobacterium stanieri (strain ATCC 29140 / PCC 7202) TaxID=292563 RepID=K9YMG9_CYASC|nr:hypothetical protein Cyast_1639 [Cyanobacterium stanieri PCC 7202]